MLKEKIDKLLKDYYKMTSAEVNVSVYENKPNAEEKHIYWFKKDIYPDNITRIKTNFSLSSVSSYRIETVVSLRLYIDLDKLRNLKQEICNPYNNLDIIFKTISDDVRNAFSIDKSIKENISLDSVNNACSNMSNSAGIIIGFYINKNHRMLIWADFPKVKDDSYTKELIPLRKQINIVIKRTKICNPFF